MQDERGKVVRLFYSEADLEEAWQRFDAANIRLHDLYRDPAASEQDRRAAGLEAARLEVEFRQVFARTEAPRLLSA